jgi:aryl-alcohol dehydrogenase-like predicted oxidoreductase
MDLSYGSVRVPQDQTQRVDWSRLLLEAAELGISALDTATAYRNAHELIFDSNWTGAIHTKISNSSRAQAELEESKAQLGRDTLDVVYFHDPGLAQADQPNLQRMAEELLHNGANAVGISVYSPEELVAALNVPGISYIQIPVNPLDQRFLQGYVRRAVEAGKTVIARSVFLQGVLVAKNVGLATNIPHQLIDAARSFQSDCEASGREPVDVCLELVASIQGISGVIVGVDGEAQLKDLCHRWKTINPNGASAIDFDSFASDDADVVDPRRWAK